MALYGVYRARNVVYILDIFDDGLWLALEESVAAQRGKPRVWGTTGIVMKTNDSVHGPQRATNNYNVIIVQEGCERDRYTHLIIPWQTSSIHVQNSLFPLISVPD